MMDVGSAICTLRNPSCLLCPVSADCVALRDDRVAELPGKRARRAAVRRRIAMLVVLSRGEVLLEKRAPSGIWGGLWSLPEVPHGTDPAAALREGYGIEAASVAALQPFEHAFTHFTLEVSPWRIEACRQPAIAAEKALTWLALDDLAGCALPAPVRKLLARA
jgi:A/G-specific adenine glycosylase